jgi:hypothetical protein
MSDFAGPNQRWVCSACGKFTGLGASKYDLRDTACVYWATLCEAEKKDDGWVAVTTQESEKALLDGLKNLADKT